MLFLSNLSTDSCVSNERLHKKKVNVPHEGHHKDVPQKPRLKSFIDKKTLMQRGGFTGVKLWHKWCRLLISYTRSLPT